MKEQKQTLRFLKQLFFVGVVVFLSNPVAGQVGEASWLNGSDGLNQSPTYGIKGTPAGTNVVGAREEAVSWVDNSGDFFVFGGSAMYSGAGSAGRVNDLWRWDGTNWTWLSGDDGTRQAGTYGTKGTAAASNVPGARQNSTAFYDPNSGNAYVFGGFGEDKNARNGVLNDLWRWDGTNWTWLSGGDTTEQAAVYGTKGTAAASNVPGARRGAWGEVDSNGDIWIYGGRGLDAVGTNNEIGDLWKYDVSADQWTWVSGPDTAFTTGIYGTKGVASSSNRPGTRTNTTGWIDSSDDVWLFGGNGHGTLSDLWRYDVSSGQWTWMSGSTGYSSGVYGTKGTGAAANAPGGRYGASSWVDGTGDFLLLNGYGRDKIGNTGWLGDLWKYDVSANEWIWIQGYDVRNQNGVYGTQGTADAANRLGSRRYGVASINRSTGDVYIFGGSGYPKTGTTRGLLNDLWTFDPTTLPVDFVYFTAQKTGANEATLQWQTAMEQNNEGFVIERSADGQPFEAIGFEPGQGTSNELNDYSYVDDINGTAGSICYRLKQVDFDGKYAYSEVACIRQATNLGNSALTVYPNPAQDALYLQLKGVSSSFEVDVIRLDGAVVMQASFAGEPHKNTIDVSQLKAGIYLIKATQRNGATSIQRVVIQ